MNGKGNAHIISQLFVGYLIIVSNMILYLCDVHLIIISNSLVSVRSNIGGGSAHGSRRYLKNPLANGSLPAASSHTSDQPHGIDGHSLNGTVRSHSTTASTASLNDSLDPQIR